MIYGECVRFASMRWLSQGFLFGASAVGIFHFLRLNWWLAVLSNIPLCFFFYFSLGRVNIAVCIPSGNEECAPGSPKCNFSDFKLMHDT